MSLNEKSLDTILGTFEPTEAREGLMRGGCLTIWLTPEYKEKYDKLQGMSGRRFIKTLRELIQAAIDQTEARAS